MQRLRDGGEQTVTNGQGNGPQDQPWQPRYDPRDHGQRLRGPQGQQWQQPGYRQPPYPGQPQYPQYPPQGQPWPPQGYQPPQGPPPGWQPGYGQQPPYPPQAYAPRASQAAPRKKHRVFMWVFLAVQVLFLIWVITGIASHPAGPSASVQAAQQCANGGWQGLFNSQADCDQHYAVGLNDASNLGKGLGVALIVVFWCIVDFLMGITYLIVRLARRRA